MRRAVRLLTAAGAGSTRNQEWYQDESEDPNKMHDYMTLQNACSLFGYQLSDRIEKGELKKRFNKLAIKHHPDHGGSEEGFRKLLEAHKLLQQSRHDKGGKEGRFKFHKSRHPGENHKGTTKPTKDDPFGQETDDHKKFDGFDVTIFFCVMAVVVVYYVYRMLDLNNHLQRSRGRLTEEEMADGAKLMQKPRDWHPWKASQHERDQVDQLAVIQGSVSEEEAARKQKIKGELAPSPFTRV